MIFASFEFCLQNLGGMNDQLYRRYSCQIQFLYLLQLIYLLFFVVFYTYVHKNIHSIKSDNFWLNQKLNCKTTTRRDVWLDTFSSRNVSIDAIFMRKNKDGILVENRSKNKRKKRSNGLKNSKIEDWTLIFGDDTIIPVCFCVKI